jgi:hypothetical protein
MATYASKALLLAALRAKFPAAIIDDVEWEVRKNRLPWPDDADGSGADAAVKRYLIRYIDSSGASTSEQEATCYHVRVGGVDEWSCNCEIDAPDNDLDKLRKWISHADRGWTVVDIDDFRPGQRSIDAVVIVAGALVRKAVVKTGGATYVTADYSSV